LCTILVIPVSQPAASYYRLNLQTNNAHQS
jgi:hypothetical protein